MRGPSPYVLKKAWDLGQKMATTDRRVRPVLSGAHQYGSYDVFRQTHRHRLEQLDAFLPWDLRVQQLIDREANGSGSDDPRMWGAFTDLIAGPIRSAFWYGWELAQDLESLYHAEVKRLQDQTEASYQVYHARPLDWPEPRLVAKPRWRTEQELSDIWAAVAERLFEQMSSAESEKLLNSVSPQNCFGAMPEDSWPSGNHTQAA